MNYRWFVPVFLIAFIISFSTIVYAEEGDADIDGVTGAQPATDEPVPGEKEKAEKKKKLKQQQEAPADTAAEKVEEKEEEKEAEAEAEETEEKPPAKEPEKEPVVKEAAPPLKKEAAPAQQIITEEESEAVVEEEDMILIEDESEESIFEAEAEADTEKEQVAADSTRGDSAQLPAQAGAGEKEDIDKEGVLHREDVYVEPSDTKEQAPAAIEEKQKVIESPRSVNFAKNLENYRSPRRAMIMSLLVPGLGQAYVKKYVKTAIFGLAEAAIIGVGINYGLKGRDAKEKAHAFADQHYSVNRFWSYYNHLDEFLRAEARDSATIADIKQSIIWDSTEFADNANEKNNSFYEGLESNPYVQGWTDCEPVLDTTLNTNKFTLDSVGYRYQYVAYKELGQGDSTWLFYQIRKNGSVIDTLNDKLYTYGFSEYQKQYIDKMRVSNNYYRISSGVLFLLIANHVISAVDAMISARAHNDRLLNRETFWRHINLDQQVAYTGTDLISTFGIKVRF